MEIVTTAVGVILAAMIGMALSKLNDIKGELKKLNGKFYVHVTDPNLHAAEAARTSEQIKNLMQITKVAHERIDTLKATL